MIELTFEVLRPEIKVNTTRVGKALIRYGILEFDVDICVYKNERLWVRMPETWLDKERKKRLVWVVDKDKSDQFQLLVLKKVFDVIGLDLAVAIQKRDEFRAARKELTEQKNKLTLSEKDSED